jgi:hypothetical protein
MIKINEEEELYEQEFTSKPEPCAECVSDCEYDEIEYVLDFFVENDIYYCSYCGSVL